MKNRYSPRLYEILKSYQYNNKKWTFENGTGSQYDLQRKIADTILEDGSPVIPETWSNWAIFKRNVLEPAVKEINKYTDIKIAYEGKKEDLKHQKTRAVRSIEFYMAGKTSLEQQETDYIIDAEYSVIEDEILYSQMSIEEIFFQEHNKKIEEEVLKMEEDDDKKNEEQLERQIESSRYALLTECLEGNFTEEQIEFLYNTAIRNRVAGNVSFSQWERFATDIITYYYSVIKATPEETKTTPYKRLSDMVRNDYHKIVPEILEQYSMANK